MRSRVWMPWRPLRLSEMTKQSITGFSRAFGRRLDMQMRAAPQTLPVGLEYMVIAKAIERIGDHAAARPCGAVRPTANAEGRLLTQVIGERCEECRDIHVVI